MYIMHMRKHKITSLQKIIGLIIPGITTLVAIAILSKRHLIKENQKDLDAKNIDSNGYI